MKVLKSVPITPAQANAFEEAEGAAREILGALGKANNNEECEIVFRVCSNHDYSTPHPWSFAFETEARIGGRYSTTLDGGHGKTLRAAMTKLGEITDADLKRSQANRYVTEAKRLRKEARELEKHT